jgi:predicted XRE-type DNA-binding protein
MLSPLCECGCGGHTSGPSKHFIKNHSVTKASHARIPKPLAEKFWAKVQRGQSHECWLWIGVRFPDGYGFMHRSSKPLLWWRAHCLSWEVHCGPIPNGLCVLHHCDNPSCVNPAHLYVGTRADNARDRALRKRGKEHRQYGEANDNAKLREADVRRIIACLKAGQSQTAIARQFGIVQPHVSRIAHRRTWQHLWDE